VAFGATWNFGINWDLLHENVEAIKLLDNTCIVRRLQRKKPFELV
jgi:hypothetical protein